MDLVHLDQLIHARKKLTLQFEAALVIRVGEDEVDVLENVEEVLLKEDIGDSYICAAEFINNFCAHYEIGQCKTPSNRKEGHHLITQYQQCLALCASLPK